MGKTLIIQKRVYSLVIALERISKEYGYDSRERAHAARALSKLLPEEVLCHGLKPNGEVEAEMLTPQGWEDVAVRVEEWNPYCLGNTFVVFLAEGHKIMLEIERADPRSRNLHSYFEGEVIIPEIGFYTFSGEEEDPWSVNDLGIFKNPVAVMRKIMRVIARNMEVGETYKFYPTDIKRERIYKKMCSRYRVNLEEREGYLSFTV
jgi:hypothetical protein